MQNKALKLLQHCTVCPRQCGVNRMAGEPGFCGASGESVYVARAALHTWEEPCISGKKGSGTVFFCGCSLQCVFCQNREISRGMTGQAVSVAQLAGIFLRLQEKGAHNLNLVTPTHYVPQILPAIAQAKADGLTVPVVYNTSGYETEDTIQGLDGFVDVYLTDFKYKSKEYSRNYSNAADYFTVAKAALAQMVKQAGQPEFDSHGMMTRGVLVRVLVLPGLVQDAKEILQYIYSTYGDSVFISIMNQYTPPADLKFTEIARPVTEEEYEEVVDYAADLGIVNGFVQEGGTVSESFIPPFNEGLEF